MRNNISIGKAWVTLSYAFVVNMCLVLLYTYCRELFFQDPGHFSENIFPSTGMRR